MLSGKTQGMKSFLLFISLLLMATLACQTLLGDAESEANAVETSIEPLPTDNSVDSTDLSDEQAIEEEIPEEVVEESDQDAASGTASETDLEVEEDEGSDVQESSETAEEPEKSSEQSGARPLSEAESLVLGRIGFVQKPESPVVDYAFHIENPNADFGIQDSEYQISVFDNNGTLLDTTSGSIYLVLPSEETAIASFTFVDEGLRAAEIEVQINSGEPVILDSIPVLAITSTRYFAEGSSVRATGILESQFGEYMEDIIVTAVAYDSQGNIVGSGRDYVDWIDSGDSTGVQAYIDALEEVDSIGIYPRTTYSSFYPSYGILPEGAANFELIDFGHFQDENGVAFGIVTQNPNPNFAIEDAKYTATAYANDGSVLFVARNYFDLGLPGDKMVSGGFFHLETFEEIAGIDYRLRAGKFIETDPIPPIGAENISYQADGLFPTVTGEVLNPFSWELEDVSVWAILYDEDDKIIGTGYGSVEFIPANGTAATEFWVDGGLDPARVELYPAVTYYEEVEGPPE